MNQGLGLPSQSGSLLWIRLKKIPIETLKLLREITFIKVNIETGLPSDKDSPETS